MRGLERGVVLIAAVLMVAGAAVADDYFPQSVASGDPKPDSVVLWTRVVGPDGDIPESVDLTVATDMAMTDVVVSRAIDVDAEYDGVVKLKVGGLMPYHDYYYQFSVPDMGVSPVGRTRTAPLPDSDQPVRFAIVYCQDYIGRYYNAYLKMLLDHDEDIDFIVHLGDYVYETTGAPSFQDPTSDRMIEFEDTEGAIQLGSAEDPYYAAASLSNYRDLYRTYRSDEVLQEVHERWPMLVIWDDHEFSDDSWGATATYTDGLEDEYDVDRKQNAERAFFEWVPIDAGLGDDGELDIDPADLYPNAMIYRDLLYGSNLHLVLTDLRSFRPDHLIPEDAFPGSIAVDEPALADLVGEAWPAVRGNFDPYVDMGLLGIGLPILQQTSSLIAANLYMMENPALDFFTAYRMAAGVMSGNVSATFVNLMYEASGLAPPFPPDVLAALPRGISYLIMGKTSIYAYGGSRVQLIKDTFDLYAAHMYDITDGAAQEAYGSQQNAWLGGSLLMSPATWKVLGNSFMMTPLVIDFTNPLIAGMLPEEFPDALRTRLLLNAEDFNGLPQKRMELIGTGDTPGLLDLVDNAVVISGDIHATFVTDHLDGVYEFTPPAITSATFAELTLRFALSSPILGQIPGIGDVIANLGLLMQVSAMDPAVSPSNILYENNWAHGYAIADVTADAFTVTIQEISSGEAGTSYYDDPEALDDLFTPVMFTIRDGVLAPGP
jgi:alkaline phosphatase D